MATKAIPMDVRMLIATWPGDSPRGAVTRFCAQHGLSRSQFYELRRRSAVEPLEVTLQPRSRAPHRSPQAISAELEDAAVRVRKQLLDDGWDGGPLSVQTELRRLGLPAPSRSTLARIFVRRGLVTPTPSKRPRSSYRRFEYDLPNECWQLDATEWALRDRSLATIFQVLDDRSRRLLAQHATTGETSAGAMTVTCTALASCGVPQRFLTDNGAALNPSRRGRTGRLTRHLLALGVTVISSRPHHPQTCGKNERVHQTLKRWLSARPRATDLHDLQRQLDEFADLYNNRRPHQALDGHTPDQTWHALPTATAPTPPGTPPAATAPTRPPLTATRHTVTTRGRVNLRNCTIHLGQEHARHDVLALHDSEQLDIFTADGTHIRSVTLVPGRTHYASGRPRGGNPNKRNTPAVTPPPDCPGSRET